MKGLKPRVISILAIGLLAGSAVGVSAQTDQAPSVGSVGCDGPLAEPGVYDGINDVDDVTQAYLAVVPHGYAELAPASLILRLSSGAGGGSLATNFEYWQPYLDVAESLFVTVEMAGQGKREPTTLTALIDDLLAAYCIDPLRVHAMGSSSSAPTVARLACDAPDRVGSVFIGVAAFDSVCTPERPVPLMAMTGDPDRRAVSDSVETWAAAYGCDPEPISEDLGSGVTRSAYQGCQADIVMYDVEGAGHGFIREACLGERFEYCFQNDVFDQLREVERFFAEHPLDG